MHFDAAFFLYQVHMRRIIKDQHERRDPPPKRKQTTPQNSNSSGGRHGMHALHWAISRAPPRRRRHHEQHPHCRIPRPRSCPRQNPSRRRRSTTSPRPYHHSHPRRLPPGRSCGSTGSCQWSDIPRPVNDRVTGKGGESVDVLVPTTVVYSGKTMTIDTPLGGGSQPCRGQP